MRARTTLAAILLTASAATLAVRHLPNPFPRKTSSFALDPDQRQRLKEARAAFAPYPTLTFTETTTAADLRAIFDAAPELPVPVATPLVPATLTPEEARRRRAEIHGLMAEFLLYAVIKQDPNAYAAWRLGRKDRFFNRDELERYHYLTDTWVHYKGVPPPETLTGEEFFRFMYDLAASESSPERRVVGILQDPDTTFTQMWFENHHIFVQHPWPEPLGEMGWHGSRMGGLSSLFTSSMHRDHLFQRTDPILRARLGVILLDAGGIRHPMIIYVYWHPPENRWILDYLNLGNFDPDAYLRFTW